MSIDTPTEQSTGQAQYKAAGVDIDAAGRAVGLMKRAVRATYTANVLADVGSFGGLFALTNLPAQPVLVASTDGVGTKVKLAADLQRWHGIGHDIVNHCINDILVQNARPLFFLDYIATSKLVPEAVAAVVTGIADACQAAGCALLGGETAEMPGVYVEGAFDVAGTVVGLVDRATLWPQPAAMRTGDVLIGLPSSGPHTNGYSLIRKIVADAGLKFSNAAPFDAKRTLGEALLAPTRIYVKSVLPLLRRDCVKGFAHITGGGLTDNVPRVFDEKVFAAAYDDAALALPPLFDWLKQTGGLSDTEMRRTFNCGIGGVVVVAASDANDILVQLKAAGENARIIGHIAKA
ncbi:MAG: phosphoribosylformylglycinamidine cyclo-ligase [Caldilineaceae bacterium]|nr:phosphoribosylformylglycinamidine cyclo-ligase [Caldilineaceae bacterium]